MFNPATFLSQSGFFRDFSPESCQRLASLSQVVELRRRQHLFREDDPGQAVFILAMGRIQLHRSTEDGRDVVIKVVQPGDLFGEVVLFERPTYPVCALALADSTLLQIPCAGIHELLEDRSFRNDFLGGLMKKLRFLTGRIMELTAGDIEDRLLSFLRDQLGPSGAGELPMTKQDVAAAIGTTPETLSRILNRLSRENRLSWKGRQVQLQTGALS